MPTTSVKPPDPTRRRHPNPPAGIAPAPPASRRSRRWRWAALAALLAVGLAGLALHRLRPARPAAPATPAGEEARLQRAVAARPDDAAARLALGEYEAGQGRPFAAIWEYAEARRLAPGDATAGVRLAAALQAAQAPEQAEPLLIEALRRRPGDREARRQLAELYLDRAAPKPARAVLETRRQETWQDAASVLTLGRALEAEGNDPDARAAYQRALALDPKDDEAQYRRGRLALRLGRTDEARDAFFHAMFYRQSRPEYPFAAGLTYLRQTDRQSLERALKFFKTTLTLHQDDAPAHYQSGVALERLGKPSPALTEFSLATVADPAYPDPLPPLSRGLKAVGRTTDAHHFLGRYYDLKDRPADAIREYGLMQADDPRSAEPAILIGQVYLRTQQNDKAQAVTEAALRQHPNDAELLERLAVLEINRGNWRGSRRVLQQWLARDSKASRACWLFGRCALGELKYAEAVDWLQKAVAAEPHNGHYLGYLGAALLKAGAAPQRARAAAVLAEAVERAPEEAGYHELYGQALEQLGRTDAARQQYLRALDADPSRISAYLAAAALAGRLRCPGAAALFPALVRSVQQRAGDEKLLRRQVRLHPESVAGRLALARFLCATARLAPARDQLEQAVAQQPAPADARALLETVRRSMDVM